MKSMRIVTNEKGSMTVEFIGVLPLIFLIMLICWQFLVGVYGVITAQAAANEAAKVYAITRDSGEALDAARTIVNAAGGGIGYVSGSIDSGNYFTARVSVAVDLIFIPDWIRKNMDPDDKVITFEREITSRVIR